MPLTKTRISCQIMAVSLAALLTGSAAVATQADDRCAPLATLVAWTDYPPALDMRERDWLARRIEADSLFLGLSDSLVGRLQQGLRDPATSADPLSMTDKDRLRYLLHLCKASAWGVSTTPDRPSQIGFDLPRNWPKLLALVLLGSAGIALLLRRERQARRQKRREARVVCRIASRYSCPDGTEFPTMIGDISRSGCRMRNAGGALHEGANVTVTLGDRAIAARVQWCNTHYAGLRFDPPLSRGDVARIIAISRQSGAGHPTPEARAGQPGTVAD
ncbi:MAG: PilZ domain-containing protein [Rhodobacteraceae bacterium]|nr:PilZ domain-containing protein [Paracoccaceae bacterium]